MTSVKIGAEERAIDQWLAVWLDNKADTDQRCAAAKHLDELLRAPVWPK